MNLNKTVLVTGGLGFIGSHLCVELLKQDFDVVILDNLFNSHLDTLDNIQKLNTSKSKIFFEFADLLDRTTLEKIFEKYTFEYVIHLAGLKSVKESIENPLTYYHINIEILLNLLSIMTIFKCKKLIFSSSATVYGANSLTQGFTEDSTIGVGITNPYGRTKYFQEMILQDLYRSDNEWSIVILRYFNPIGAHPSGLLGERPKGSPNNLFPAIIEAIVNESKTLKIYGEDYNTSDGTCERDFIHVVDLSKGHIDSSKKFNQTGVHIFNLGTGKPISVKCVIDTFERIGNIKINKVFMDRREGDTDAIYANVSKAQRELGWKATFDIERSCMDTLNYIQNL